MKGVFPIKDLIINQNNRRSNEGGCEADLPAVRAVMKATVKLDNEASKGTLLDKIRMIQARLFVRFPTFVNIPQNLGSLQEFSRNLEVLFRCEFLIFFQRAELSPDHNKEGRRSVVKDPVISIA